MPYAVPDGGILACNFEGVVLGQQMITTLHYRLDNPGGITDGAAYLDGFFAQITGAGKLHDKYLDCLSAMYTTARIRLQWILPTRFAYKVFMQALTAGQALSEVAAPNLAVAITKRGPMAGAHFRGTVHMPAVPLNHITLGEVNGVGFGVYNAFADSLKEVVPVLAGDAQPVIYNRTTPGDTDIVEQCTVSEKLRTMHRRTVGLGS